MSAHPVVELHCDEPGCDAGVTTGQRLVWEARREAAYVARWTSIAAPRPTKQGPMRTLDYCPDHGPGAPR